MIFGVLYCKSALYASAFRFENYFVILGVIYETKFMELRSGVILHNTYRIIRVLGQGGFGITYLAEHLLLEQQVAIKEFFPKALCSRDADTSNVRPGTVANTEQVGRLKMKFLKEATHIAKLSNPYIIRIRDVFEQNDTAYYVMDYIEGHSLSDIVKESGPLPIQRAVKYITEIGNALSYVHTKHINHLDVKPGNIMVRQSDDTAILLDFGLAKQYDDTGRETSSTPIGVSHGYAPIEQYQEGGVKEFSPQTDLYSLAATFYYLITGRTPDNATTLIDNALYIPASVPTHIAAAIRKAMSTSRKDRQQTIQAFLNEITAHPGSTPNSDQTQFAANYQQTHNPEAARNTTAMSGKSSNKSLWILVSVVIVVAAACIVLFILNDNGSSHYSDDDEDSLVAPTEYAEEEAIVSVSSDDLAQADKYYDSGNYTAALEIYLRAANQGVLENYNRLGWMYQYAQGTTQDFSEAAKWYQEGAVRGDAKAQRNLGILYRYGNGVPQDNVKAAALYQQAAEQGDANALNNLGYMYREGYGVPQSYSRAFDLFQEAAAQGYVRAFYNLGYMYYYGLGVPVDEGEAFELWAEAAGQGDTKAKESLEEFFPDANW